MSASLRLSPVDPSDLAELLRVADAARAVDGTDPFNEQARLDVAAGRRDGVLVVVDGAASGGAAGGGAAGGGAAGGGAVVGAAIVGGGGALATGNAGARAAGTGGAGELDLVVDPMLRGKGYGHDALAALLPRFGGTVTAWSHGDHPAARALAKATGFERVRTLLQLALPLTPEKAFPRQEGGNRNAEDATSSRDVPGSIRIAAFRPGTDDAEWVALNARVFAAHPEQGAVTLEDLRDRMAEDWFDAGDFLVARDETGRMVGYNWLKVEGPDAASVDGESVDGESVDGESVREGEIYVIGVDAASAGRGLGRTLMLGGLQRLRERGCSTATLYVEGDNEPALRLYRSLGFTDRMVDVQYRRG